MQLRSKSVTYRGPRINPPAGGVSQTPGPSSDTQHPSSSTPATSAVSDQPSGTTEEETSSIKGYKCDHCGVVKARKPDLRGHLWTVHKIGTPIVCNMGLCAGKSFSCESSLKQHIRTQHQGDFKFKCKKCPFKSDNSDALVSHMYTKHSIVGKDKATGRKEIYKCVLCHKNFVGKHLLRKHQKDENCIKKKTLKCDHCVRKFKSPEGLKYHVEHYHQGKRSPCPKCGTLLPEKSMRNHMRRHGAQQLLQEARLHVAKVGSARRRYFAFTSRRLGKMTVKPKSKSTTLATKSAPPKLRKAASPKKPAGK